MSQNQNQNQNQNQYQNLPQDMPRDMPRDQNNDYDCFIRRRGPHGWTRGRAHHRRAMELFLEMSIASVEDGEPVRISVPHADGGNFIAFFRRINPAVCQYRDEYDQTVDIMMSSGSYTAYINRVVSSY